MARMTLSAMVPRCDLRSRVSLRKKWCDLARTLMWLLCTNRMKSSRTFAMYCVCWSKKSFWRTQVSMYCK